MTIDIAKLTRQLGLELGKLAPLVQGTEPERLVEITRDALLEQSSAIARSDVAILYLLARATSPRTDALTTEITAYASEWLQKHWKERVLLEAEIAHQNPEQLEELLSLLLEMSASNAAIVINAAGWLPADRGADLLERVGKDTRDDVREHLFALWAKHQRLPVPASVHLDNVPDDRLLAILRTGVRDPVATVRQRAIAAAYGLGMIAPLGNDVIGLVRDPEPHVRQYALVALGVLDDSTTLQILMNALEHGEEDEIKSAIWALARRPDGVERLLSVVGSSKAWDREIAGAIAEVSSPLSDEKLESVASKISEPLFPRLRERHIARTRHGAPERGPDHQLGARQTKAEAIYLADETFDRKETKALFQLLQAGTKPEKARSIGALARRSATDMEVRSKVLQALTVQSNRTLRVMGTISIAHIGIACLYLAGDSTIRREISTLVEQWPEPDRTDLRWFLRSQGIEL